MKNIHLLPTTQPSRLYLDSNNNTCITDIAMKSGNKQNIYTTNDEDIEEGDWFHLDMSHSSNLQDEIHQMGSDGWSKTGGIHFCEGNSWIQSCKKIILTDNQDLIADGVQAIDDDFLKWFVKNPSCEEVEISSNWHMFSNKNAVKNYGVITPKEEQIKCYCGHTTTCDCEPLEEPKQETLPELVNIPMMVSMDGKNWKRRNVIALSKGIYVTSNDIKTDADTDEEFRSIDYWKFAKTI